MSSLVDVKPRLARETRFEGRVIEGPQLGPNMPRENAVFAAAAARIDAKRS